MKALVITFLGGALTEIEEANLAKMLHDSGNRDDIAVTVLSDKEVAEALLTSTHEVIHEEYDEEVKHAITYLGQLFSKQLNEKKMGDLAINLTVEWYRVNDPKLRAALEIISQKNVIFPQNLLTKYNITPGAIDVFRKFYQQNR